MATNGVGLQGTFPGTSTTGYRTIGAVQKAGTGSVGFPGLFPGTSTTGYYTIGAVQRPTDATGTLTVTLGALTLASTGTVAVNGTASITLGACTLVATGTVTSSGSTLKSGGGEPLEPRRAPYAQPRIGSHVATAHGRTRATADGKPVGVRLATAYGHTSAIVHGTLVLTSNNADARGHSAVIGHGGMCMAPRNRPYHRAVSSGFAIG